MFTFVKRNFFATLGSFIIAAGWGWYHFSKHPKELFAIKEIALWVAVFVGYKIGRMVFAILVKAMKRHHYWHTDFLHHLDEFFFFFSLLFVIFFLRSELVSLVYISFVSYLLYRRSNYYLSHHPGGSGWIKVNRAIFSLGYFLFLVQAGLQYSAYHYYILDSNIRFFNIVLFRSVAMTLVWLFGFVVASFLFWKLPRVLRYFALIVWGLMFVFFVTVWMTNLGILYYSGLYISPVAIEHALGSSQVVKGSIAWYLVVLGILVVAGFVYIVGRVIKIHTAESKRYWFWYLSIISLAGLGSLVGLTSLQNTPERAIITSFYNFYFGSTTQSKLDPAIVNKLKKFGLNYKLDNFYVGERAQVFTPTTTKLLPDKFVVGKPNVVIVFLEGFSARLTDVYSDKFPGVTPNFLEYTKNPNVTVFKNYYNASTPTITGTLSQLCSFLPPTGHNEIQNERKLQSHRLLCLPEVLKKYGGFKFANYVTAVDKEFSHKDGIFTSMGVDKVYGTEELAQVIKGEPLSWGYSDHQLFPALYNFMVSAKQQKQEPFLMMLATVDTHPPFNLPKDPTNYKDGSQAVLNMFHTTDDAFGKFWEQFKNSEFYNNTIVITVADHAIFPSAITRDLFPEIADKLTYYDPNFFAVYVPNSVLPREVSVLSSGLDFMPTLLQMFNINIPNSFEGHSVFDDRDKYPNILGMHELGLYINQVDEKSKQQTANSKRKIDYNVPSEIQCSTNYVASTTWDLTECDYLQFYNWKRAMFEEGRFWKH